MKNLRALGLVFAMGGILCVAVGCATGGAATASAQNATATGGNATITVAAPLSLSLGDSVAKEAAEVAQSYLRIHPADSQGAVKQGFEAGVSKAIKDGHVPTAAEKGELESALTKAVSDAKKY